MIVNVHNHLFYTAQVMNRNALKMGREMRFLNHYSSVERVL